MERKAAERVRKLIKSEKKYCSVWRASPSTKKRLAAERKARLSATL